MTWTIVCTLESRAYIHANDCFPSLLTWVTFRQQNYCQNAVNYRLTQRGITYTIVYVSGTHGVEQCPTYPALCGSLDIVWGHRDRGVTSILPWSAISTCSLFVPIPSMATLLLWLIWNTMFILDSKVDLRLCDQEEEIWNAVLDVIFTLFIFEVYKEGRMQSEENLAWGFLIVWPWARNFLRVLIHSDAEWR